MPTDRWQSPRRTLHRSSGAACRDACGFPRPHVWARCRMREEIALLLTAAGESNGFLSAPALDVFARQISREGWSVQPGDRIAAYTVERRLGAGGAGEVWRARDERLGRDVAIKLLLPHPSNAAERGRAFQDEARAAGTLNHINVLTVYQRRRSRRCPVPRDGVPRRRAVACASGRRPTFCGRGTRRRHPGGPRPGCARTDATSCIAT